MIWTRVALAAAIFLAATNVTARTACQSAYCAYRQEVERQTEANYKRHRDTIDPLRLRGRQHGYDLDHIIPVKQCWLRKMTADECAAPTNLRILDARKNRSEGCRATGCAARRD